MCKFSPGLHVEIIMLLFSHQWVYECCSAVSNSLRPCGLYSPWNSPGHNTGVGGRSLLQGIFPTQGLNPDLPHCKQILYQLSHQRRPRILEWVAYSSSSGLSSLYTDEGEIQWGGKKATGIEEAKWRRIYFPKEGICWPKKTPVIHEMWQVEFPFCY